MLMNYFFNCRWSRQRSKGEIKLTRKK